MVLSSVTSLIRARISRLHLALTIWIASFNGEHTPKSLCKISRNKLWQVTKEQYHSGHATLTVLSQLYTKTKSTIFKNISTEKTSTFSLPRRSRTIIRFLFLTASSFVTTTTVYRKPTHTDRLLDESSYNTASHKATTMRTLTRRALLVCDSHDSLA